MLFRQSMLFVTLLALILGATVTSAEPISNRDFSDAASDSPSLAQSPGGFQNRQGRKGKLMEQLNLSDSQRQQLDGIRQKYQQQISQLRDKMGTERQELREMLVGTASATAIREKHTQMLKLRQTIDNLRFESMLEMREILTPEQRSQFAQMMEQHRGQFRQRFRNRFNDEEF